MAKKRTSKNTRVSLYGLYKASGKKKSYDSFVKTDVSRIIGSSSIRRRGTDYTVTKRNLDRVSKSLNINMIATILSSVLEGISKAGENTSAVVKVDGDYPFEINIPLHPISHNHLYDAVRSRFRRSKRYSEWRDSFFELIGSSVPKSPPGLDLSKPVEVEYTFGHREASDGGFKFDRANFQKAVQDCLFEHFGFDDSKVLKSSVLGSFVDKYSDGFMKIKMRNINE